MSGQLVLATRILVVIVFAAAAFGKLRSGRNLAGFVSSLAPLGVPAAVRRPIGVAVPVAEAATVVLVALPATAAIGLAAATLVLATFSLAIGIALRGGRVVPCRCFGSTGADLGLSHLIRNGLLAVITGGATALRLTAPDGPSGVGAIAAPALLGGFMALAAIYWDDVATLLFPTRAGRES